MSCSVSGVVAAQRMTYVNASFTVNLIMASLMPLAKTSIVLHAFNLMVTNLKLNLWNECVTTHPFQCVIGRSGQFGVNVQESVALTMELLLGPGLVMDTAVWEFMKKQRFAQYVSLLCELWGQKCSISGGGGVGEGGTALCCPLI